MMRRLDGDGAMWGAKIRFSAPPLYLTLTECNCYVILMLRLKIILNVNLMDVTFEQEEIVSVM